MRLRLTINTNWFWKSPVLMMFSCLLPVQNVFLAARILCQKFCILDSSDTLLVTYKWWEVGMCYQCCHMQGCWRAGICSVIPCIALNLSLPKVSWVTMLQEGSRPSEQVAVSTDTERCSSCVLARGMISCWTILSSCTVRGMCAY